MKATSIGSAEDFVGGVVRPGAAADRVFRDAAAGKVVYLHRFEPTSQDEHDEFIASSASAYELYVICDDAGEIEEVNQRVEQAGCGHPSLAPHCAPAFIFPPGAVFDIEWKDVAESAQERMRSALRALVGDPKAEA